jgi:hypothetical protein
MFFLQIITRLASSLLSGLCSIVTSSQFSLNSPCAILSTCTLAVPPYFSYCLPLTLKATSTLWLPHYNNDPHLLPLGAKSSPHPLFSFLTSSVFSSPVQYSICRPSRFNTDIAQKGTKLLQQTFFFNLFFFFLHRWRLNLVMQGKDSTTDHIPSLAPFLCSYRTGSLVASDTVTSYLPNVHPDSPLLCCSSSSRV